MVHLLTLALACSIASGAAAKPHVADDSLVGYWKLQGDYRDYSGHGNDGVSHGMSLCGSAKFSGNRAYVEVPDSPSLRLGSGDFTASAWVKCDDTGAQVIGDILSKYDPSLRRGLNLGVTGTATAYSSIGDQRQLVFGIDNAADGEWVDCGAPCATNPLISVLVTWNGALYAGTGDASDPDDACRVYRYERPGVWTDCGRVSPDLTFRSVQSAIVHNGSLYAGTGVWDWEFSTLSNPVRVYRYDGGKTWTDCGQVGDAHRVNSLSSLNKTLYATVDSGEVYRYEGGTAWTRIGKSSSYKFISSYAFDGSIYGGASTTVERYDGDSQWAKVGEWPYSTVCQVHCFTVYGGKLHAGTWDNGKTLRYEGGTRWSDCGNVGVSITDGYRINEINDLTAYNGKLYAGVIPLGQVWRYESDGDWTMLKRLVHNPAYNPHDLPSWCRVPCMSIFGGRLYAGTSSCQSRASNADFSTEIGRVYSYEAGRCLSYDKDLGAAWRLVTAVRDGRTLKLYVDGKLVSQSSAFDPSAFDLSNDRPLLIGFGQESYFHGEMRDVRLYNRALPESQIARLAREKE